MLHNIDVPTILFAGNVRNARSPPFVFSFWRSSAIGAALQNARGPLGSGGTIHLVSRRDDAPVSVHRMIFGDKGVSLCSLSWGVIRISPLSCLDRLLTTAVTYRDT